MCVTAYHPFLRRLSFDSRPRQETSLFSTASRPVLGPIHPLIQWVTEALSPGVKRSEREAHHLSPSSAMVKNCGAVPPLARTFSWQID
jgi:hypothetical protein